MQPLPEMYTIGTLKREKRTLVFVVALKAGTLLVHPTSECQLFKLIVSIPLTVKQNLT